MVLRGCLLRRRAALLEALVLSPNEATSIHLRAQILLLDWLTDGRWEAEELTPATPTAPPVREYLARDRDE